MTRVTALSLLVACSSAPPLLSTDVSSRDVRLDVTVEADASGGRMRGSVGGPAGLVRLVDGDRVESELDPGELIAVRTVGSGLFEGDLGSHTGTLHVLLSRPHDATVETTLFVPPAFELRAPATASRASGLTLTWDSSTGPYKVTLSIGGSCIGGAQRTLKFDSGTYSFSPGELATPNDATTCTAKVVMVRAAGTATQTRETTFESTP